MNARLLKIFAFCFLMPLLVKSQDDNEKAKILEIVQYFFDALKTQDTTSLKKLFVKEAMNYYVQEREDSVITVSQSPLQINFRKDRVIVERMRSTAVTVQVHQRIATAWVPYDLWVNGKFSHCGIDVFTMIKSKNGWKISSLSFTRQLNDCNTP
ncbi:MAG: nuclear transport factor 2 family protein [Bacteroidota bacterium]